MIDHKATTGIDCPQRSAYQSRLIQVAGNLEQILADKSWQTLMLARSHQYNFNITYGLIYFKEFPLVT